MTLLRRLEPRSGVTLRKFRYIAQLLGMAAAGRGATRLYDRVDVALIRLCLRLEAETSLWLARAAILYLEPSLREVLAHRPVGAAVRLHGQRAEYTTLHAIERGRLPGTVIKLKDVAQGIVEGIAATRRQQPDVWVWTSLPAAVAAKRVQEIAEQRAEAPV